MNIEPGRIRLVSFDLYDTLIELEPKRWERLSAVLTARGISHDPAVLKARDMVAEDYWTEINAIRPIRERDQDVQDEIEPVEFGWTNVAGYNDYASRDMTLRPDAGRYECGTLNTIGCYGLRAALDFINSITPEVIGPQVQALADIIAEGARAKGYEVLGERTPTTGAGIVSFRKEGIDSRLVVSRLKEQKFIAAPRQGWIRTSPHFYQPPDTIRALVDAL